MPDSDRVIRPTVLTRIVCAVVYIATVVVIAFQLPFRLPDRYRPVILAVLAVGGAFWLADVCLRRVVLCSDGLRLVSITRRLPRFVARAEIDSVTSEGGSAALRVRSGRWIHLPRVGVSARSLATTIRAWLKRPDAAPANKA